MDPAGPPGHLDRRTAALSGVWLKRSIELDNVRVEVRDWPGGGGPIVHVADPLRDSRLVERLTAVLPPRSRLLSIRLPDDQPYQVHVADLHGLFAQFGFDDVVVAAEGLSCASALLLAAWYPQHVHALLLIGDRQPEGDGLLERSLRECPPDWAQVRAGIACRVVERTVDPITDLQTLLG